MRHPDGYIELRDRAKDIVISGMIQTLTCSMRYDDLTILSKGGENISTIELENTILSHPSISDCAVVASPSSKWGEVPVAYVVLDPSSPIPPEQVSQVVIAYCKGKLAGYKVPKEVKVLTELPRTSTGKVRKNVLRDMEWGKGGKRIQG